MSKELEALMQEDGAGGLEALMSQSNDGADLASLMQEGADSDLSSLMGESQAPQLDPLGNPIPTMQAYEPSIGEKVEQFGRDASDFVAAMSIQNPTLNFLDFLEGDTNTEIVERNDGSLAFGEVPEPTNEERLKARGIDPNSGMAIGAKIVGEIIDPATMALGLAKTPVALGGVGKTVFGGVQAATAAGVAETTRQLGSEGQVTDAGKVLTDMSLAFGIGGALQGTLETGRKLSSVLADSKAAKLAEFESAAMEVSDLARDKIREGLDLTTAFKESAIELGYASKGGARPRKVALAAADNLKDIGSEKVLKTAVDEDLFLRGSVAGHGARSLGRAATAPLRAFDKEGKVVRGMDRFFGATSTRIRNISDDVFTVMRRMDKEDAKVVQGYGVRVQPWVNRMRELRKTTPHLARQIDEAVANGDAGVDGLMAQANIPQAVWQDVKTVLAEHKGLRQQFGLMEEGVEEFFPRVVDDVQGLRNLGGATTRSQIDDRLTAIQESQGGRPLSELQISEAISGVLRQAPKTATVGARSGSSRTVDEVTSDMLKYYKNAEEALDSYVRNSSRDIVGRKYFGGNGVQGVIPDTIAAIKDKLTPAQLDELHGLVQSRASGAALQGGALSRGLKDLSYLVTVADPVNALVQMADIPLAAYKNGMAPTIRAVGQSLQVGRSMKGLEKLSKTNPEAATPIYKALMAGDTAKALRLGQDAGLNLSPIERNIDVLDLGTANNIAADMTQDAGAMAQMVHNAFKFSGFSKLDRFGKRVHMNGAKNKLEKIAKMDDAAAYRKLADTYGDSYNLDTALQAIRKGDYRNDAVTDLIWHDLLDMQPIALTELPEFYLKNPSMRVFYTLKSFGLKQLDILRRDVGQELMNREVGPATKNAMALAAAVTLGTGSYRAGRDLLFTGETEDPHHYAIDALLGFAFASQYTLDQLKQGDLRGVVGGTMLPASLDFFGAAVEDAISLTQGEEAGKVLKYIPVVKNVVKYQEGH